MDISGRVLLADARLHAVVALAVLAGLAPARVAAQVSVEASPLRVELKTTPGGTTTQAVTLNNTGTDAVRVRATISDWYLSVDGAPQFGAAADARYSASAWMRLAPPEQVIEPGRQGTVRFNLSVPAGTDAAGYRTSILFEFGPANSSPVPHGHDVLIRSRIATLVYVTVGDPAAAVELSDLKSRFPRNQPPQIVALLKNSGKRSVRTRGTLTIYDSTGAKIAERLVPDVPVLPESEREVVIDTSDREGTARLSPGEYRVELRIDVGMAAVLVGETTFKVT